MVKSAIGLSAAAALSLVAACSETKDPSSTGQALETMRSATHVESFSLQGVGVVMDSLTPNIAGMAINAKGPDLNRSEIALLRRLVRAAIGSQCGEPMQCEFTPQYAIRFWSGDRTLDLLIELRCPTWGFRRGREAVPEMRVSTTSGMASCVADSLSVLLHGLFQDKTGFPRM